VLIQRLAVPGVLLAVGPAPHREHPGLATVLELQEEFGRLDASVA
jgi:hypothetical protein